MNEDERFESFMGARDQRELIGTYVEVVDEGRFIVWTDAGQEEGFGDLVAAMDYAQAVTGVKPVPCGGVTDAEIDAAWEQAAGGER